MKTQNRSGQTEADRGSCSIKRLSTPAKLGIAAGAVALLGAGWKTLSNMLSRETHKDGGHRTKRHAVTEDHTSATGEHHEDIDDALADARGI